MLESVVEWIEAHPIVVTGVVGASILIVLASAALAPAALVRVPADYFAHARRPPSRFAEAHPAMRVLLVIVKNVAGVALLAAGAAMLVLPGQGLLTLLVGALLIDFPGKYRFEKWLVSRRRVMRAVNWLRSRRGREALRVDGADAESGRSGDMREDMRNGRERM
jgi:hypothetical protein